MSYLLTSSLCVPISEQGQRIQPLSFAISDRELWLAFSDALKMSEFFEEPQEFTEIAPRALMRMAMEAKIDLGFDLGQDHGVLLDQDAILGLDKIFADQETLESVDGFEWQSFEASPSALSEIIEILPAQMSGWLAFEREQGLVLVINTQSDALSAEEIGQFRLRLLNYSQAEKISLLFLDENHPMKDYIQSDMEKFGIAVKAVPKTKPMKPPILR